MTVNMNETIQKIKKVGEANVRSVPMQGQSVQDGQYQIEIREGSTWTPIVTGVKKQVAESIISQAVNRVILG
jgi:hypothetical protein